MKILVYGAGVIGCELAHMLMKAGQHVTLLARGAWKDNLEKNGLVIRHYPGLHTTHDDVRVVNELRPKDVYDMIFVVMQYVQLPTVLPTIATNLSRYVVLVGNNANAETTLKALTVGQPYHEVAFGFQGTGGRRESAKVISVHMGVGMTVGALRGHLSTEFQHRIEKAFHGVNYRLTWETDMDAWLKCHLALILPVAYVCYAVDCHLPRATRQQRKAILGAALEGCEMLRGMGLKINAADNDDYYSPGKKRRKMEALLYLMAKTPLGRLAASDHCRAAVSEIKELDAVFEHYRMETGTSMPVWEELRKGGAVFPAKEGALQESRKCSSKPSIETVMRKEVHDQ